MVLSVLPGMNLAIRDHFLPYFRYRFISRLSSSRVHLFLVMFGSRWLCHLSRHCFPTRPGNIDAMKFQPRAPCWITSFLSCWSSSSVQDDLVPPWHWYCCCKLKFLSSWSKESSFSSSSSILSMSELDSDSFLRLSLSQSEYLCLMSYHLWKQADCWLGFSPMCSQICGHWSNCPISATKVTSWSSYKKRWGTKV